MLKIGFVTCSDLSRYFYSKTNPLLTHDDQLAFDFLTSKSCHVTAIPWGTDVEAIHSNFDILIIRSTWDYMDSEAKQRDFFAWLDALSSKGIDVFNDISTLHWSLNKSYLLDLQNAGVRIVPTRFLEVDHDIHELFRAQDEWQEIVIKPAISAAAKDTFRIRSRQELEDFIAGRGGFAQPFFLLRGDRQFLLQPYLQKIEQEGEWSLVFFNEEYSHAILKKPKEGGWLVQDELGGSVTSAEAPQAIQDFGMNAFKKLISLLHHKNSEKKPLLYARIDILPGLYLGEIELVEPELFFLDRRVMQPNQGALELFYQGIQRCYEWKKKQKEGFKEKERAFIKNRNLVY